MTKALYMLRGASEGERCDWSTIEREEKYVLLCVRERRTKSLIASKKSLQLL